jgi:hypothetical protein
MGMLQRNISRERGLNTREEWGLTDDVALTGDLACEPLDGTSDLVDLAVPAWIR